MKMRLNYFWISLPVLLLVAGSALADPKKAGPKNGGPKNVTECGTILTEPGNYKLANDLLECPGHGITIVGSDITLNLKGYEISCAENDLEVGAIGIIGTPEATVRNVTVKNGHVSNCRDGIVVIFAEDSKVMHITSTGNTKWEPEPGVFVYGTGITLFMSHNNVIMHNHTYGNASHGIASYESSGNLFKHNTSTDNGESGPGGGGGITLENEQNSRVMCNRVHGNVDGITLQSGGSGNLLRGNLVTGNQNTGIGMLGLALDGFFWQDIPAGNTVRSNIVEENGWFDFFEFYFDLWTGKFLLQPEDLCMNTWEKNQFQTEFGPPGCFGIPVELDDHDVCALDYDD
jgi:parallel beta-helix repeat protein